jgi:signal transduction histidine kinase
MVRVLHDEVGQILTAVGLQLDVLRLDYAAPNPEIAGRTAEIQQLLDRALVHVRHLCSGVDPAIAERIGLRAALEHLAGLARSRGVSVTVELNRDSPRVPEPPANVFYTAAAAILSYAEYRGARNITYRVSHLTDAYVLEVLYDVSSPDHLESLRRLGLAVSVISDSCGNTTIRAQYSHAIRGPAG